MTTFLNIEYVMEAVVLAFFIIMLSPLQYKRRKSIEKLLFLPAALHLLFCLLSICFPGHRNIFFQPEFLLLLLYIFSVLAMQRICFFSLVSALLSAGLCAALTATLLSQFFSILSGGPPGTLRALYTLLAVIFYLMVFFISFRKFLRREPK